MDSERRFAIIIGINDYKNQPLSYCDNDALSVAEIIEEKCRYKKEDIFTIVSNEVNPIKDLTTQVDEAFKAITSNFHRSEDSIFFYFAGHGEYHFERSSLVFHDSLVEIWAIYERINELNPRHQLYFIDACESGGKVLTRSTSNTTDIQSKFSLMSSGSWLMYATTDNEKARETERFKHGIFTYCFLNALKNDDLFDEGVLTINRIQDFITKETSKESSFKQTPVSENRTTGYYPFAFKKITHKERSAMEEDNEQTNLLIIEKEFFPSVPEDIRKLVFTNLKATINSEVETYKQMLSWSDYKVTFGNDLDIFRQDIHETLVDNIVQTAEKEGIASTNHILSTERFEKNNSGLGMLDIFALGRQPKYTFHRSIRWRHEGLISLTVNLKSENPYKVSGGIVIMIYQAIYGIGLTYSFFRENSTGFSNMPINGVTTQIEAFRFNNLTIENIKESIKTRIDSFQATTVPWNTARAKEISEFANKSK